jgi:hypothetical protein
MAQIEYRYDLCTCGRQIKFPIIMSDGRLTNFYSSRRLTDNLRQVYNMDLHQFRKYLQGSLGSSGPKFPLING